LIARLSAALLWSLAAAPAVAPALAQGDLFADRPAFSLGDQPPKTTATCANLRAMAEGLGRPEFRMDLAVGGRLTLVKSDGALWYLVMCSDLRVMCVTYQQNGMKTGDQVTFKGAYRRIDANHAILDPCLAGTEAE
jgi:hypothetical protein